MQDAVPVGTGGMLAVLGLEDDQVVKACGDLQEKARSSGLKNCVLEAANFNSPGQVVVSGHQKALEYMQTHLLAADYGGSRAKLIPLAVSAPFHSSLMKPAAERLKTQLSKNKWNKSLQFPIIHNVNAEKNSDSSRIENLLYEQVTKPVLWTSSIKNAKGFGADHFAEVGAGRVLTGLIKKIEPEVLTLNIDTIENLKKCREVLK